MHIELGKDIFNRYLIRYPRTPRQCLFLQEVCAHFIRLCSRRVESRTYRLIARASALCLWRVRLVRLVLRWRGRGRDNMEESRPGLTWRRRQPLTILGSSSLQVGFSAGEDRFLLLLQNLLLRSPPRRSGVHGYGASQAHIELGSYIFH